MSSALELDTLVATAPEDVTGACRVVVVAGSTGFETAFIAAAALAFALSAALAVACALALACIIPLSFVTFLMSVSSNFFKYAVKACCSSLFRDEKLDKSAINSSKVNLSISLGPASFNLSFISSLSFNLSFSSSADFMRFTPPEPLEVEESAAAVVLSVPLFFGLGLCSAVTPEGNSAPVVVAFDTIGEFETTGCDTLEGATGIDPVEFAVADVGVLDPTVAGVEM
ncbi:unnamed protein product [Meganyctiphanes norvegica]|uniref:Uncharacterized protein n=1 Tax=Meganyctiphanes norvegica TaxID=48144 RepID=A0AAV2SX41_MEGNR